MRNLAAAMVLSNAFLAAPATLAQTSAPPASSSDSPVVVAAEAPAETVVPLPTVAPPDQGLREQVASLEEKLARLEASDQAQKAAQASAAKLKVSGYVQGRYEWTQGSANGATKFASNGTATPANQNRFLLRHAYLTTQYNGTYGEYFMQLDANTRDGVGVRDAYVAIHEPWTPLKMKLSAGQFRYPFGYEALQSDADREMPERAPIEKFFFDGERDRGLRLQGGYGFFNFAIALVNGTVYDGSRNLAASKDPAPFGSADPNAFKDWVGRLGVDFGFLVGGVSGYFGKGLYIKPPVAATASTPGSDAVPDSRYKYRVGADLQAYIGVPHVGRLALKGEVIYGKDKARQFHGIPANPCNSGATWGFILTAVQSFARDFGVVARVDMKDTLASSIADGCTEKTAAESDRVITTGGGLLYYASPNLKLTVTYQHVAEQADKQRDNDFAMGQIQARF